MFRMPFTDLSSKFAHHKIFIFPFQINFFQDHTKVILCPLLGAVTYIDEEKRNRTFRFDLIEKYGCQQQLLARLAYACDKVNNMVSQATAKTAAVSSMPAPGSTAPASYMQQIR